MNKTIIILLILISNSIFSQEFLNLDFEQIIQGTEQPEKWYTGNPPYKISVDTIEKFQLSKSLRIECNTFKENSFGFSSIAFPSKYAKGKSIILKGKIKTENVTNGYAGLWLTAKNDDGTQTTENMNERGLTKSNDWLEVSIKLNIDKSVSSITFGVLLTGQGKAWFDNLEIFIDGEKFKDIKPKYLEPTKDELNWLREHIYPLTTYEPNKNDDDLKILNKLIDSSQIVALGETTHGSSEIFKMKHRIIKYLANNKGFDIFSIEANMPESYKLNEYIADSIGNPKDLLRGIYFWTWQTQEVLDMVEWMKTHNQSNQKIVFTGFDMQFYYEAINQLKSSFKSKTDVLNLISELKDKLDIINENKRNSKTTVVSVNDKYIISQLTNSIKKEIRKTNFSKKEMNWLIQNVRIIEQYINIDNYSRDRYMAENVLWIKSQNPNSKIAIWAHNGHIKKTEDWMGRFLSDSLKTDYLTIGFSFYKGNYTATGKNGLTSYKSQEAKVGSYEYFFNKINEPIFLLDLREIKKEKTELNKWILDEMFFRDVGAMKTTNEFYKTDLTKDFDIIIFINESTSSKLLN